MIDNRMSDDYETANQTNTAVNTLRRLIRATGNYSECAAQQVLAALVLQTKPNELAPRVEEYQGATIGTLHRLNFNTSINQTQIIFFSTETIKVRDAIIRLLTNEGYITIHKEMTPNWGRVIMSSRDRKIIFILRKGDRNSYYAVPPAFQKYYSIELLAKILKITNLENEEIVALANGLLEVTEQQKQTHENKEPEVKSLIMRYLFSKKEDAKQLGLREAFAKYNKENLERLKSQYEDKKTALEKCRKVMMTNIKWMQEIQKEIARQESGDSELPQEWLDLEQYLQSNKCIKLTEIQDQNLMFEIKTTAEINDPGAYERLYLDHPTTYMSPIRQKLMRETFIDGKYRLRVIANLCMNIEQANIERNYDFSDRTDDDTCIPQPHIQGYGCFGQYNAIIASAFERKNWTGAIAACAAACQGIAALDTPVITKLHRYIFERYPFVKCFENTETGELISWEDYKKQNETN